MTSFSFDESLGYLINRTAIQLKRELQHAFTAHGYAISPEQWELLNRIWQEEGRTQVELAQLTHKDKPNITRMLEVLERSGYVLRQPDLYDKRAYRIFLTECGRQLQAELTPLAAEIVGRAQQGLSDADLDQVRRILNHIFERIA
ncbi:MAG: MarR family transcriptional regulator [Oscillochloris sp.]|nr:MarR family transcriptional regulator [Oscillochloris sp.]